MTTGVAMSAPAQVLPDVDECRALTTSALHHGAPAMVAQPILGLSSGRVVAYEALARFPAELPSYPPDVWFSMAHACGLGPTFEARAIDIAVRAGMDRPPGTVLSLNVSPSVLSTRELHDVLPFDLSGLQFEITEQQVVDDLEQFSRIIAALRDRGARIAVDDVGEGYAGLQRVLSLSPDLIKLDRSLVTGVADEPVKAALVEAIVRYAAKVGAEVCAEGVENLDDLYVLAELDVAEAQGWVVGMPSADFEGASEAAALTCLSSLQRTLALGSRAPGQDSTALERLLAELVACDDLDSLARMTTPIAAHLKCDLAEISYLDDTGERLLGIGRLAWRPDGNVYVLDDFPLSRRCLETLEIMTVDASDPDADPAERSWMLVEGVRTVIGLPVVAAGRPVGLLECSRRDPVPWSRLQLRHARIIATVLGPVISSLSTR
jgi:EAL domain-containing protein (putative c-di-GMP-specific phosphodiesterase class I)